MPKPQYSQKFRDSWLKDPELKEWLQVVESTLGSVAKCKYCGIMLRNHYIDLKNHGQTKKHLKNIKTITSQPVLPFKQTLQTNIQKEEARIALFTAVHCSIRIVDHLGEVINHTHKVEDKISLHRTKCGNILKNVLAPHFLKILKEDLKNQPFSLLIDESTDISVNKFLGMVIIYFSTSQNKIISTYLNIEELIECNADGIIAAIKKCINQFSLSINNLKGIGTDNASVMTGINNGVYAKLRTEVPDLILVRCLCHSLQLAISNAAKQFLPRNLEFIIRETYDWFSRSSSRQTLYKELYKAINDGQNPLKIVQSCQTRWLSIESAVSRIYGQWMELKTHFLIAKVTERCYTAEMLHCMYEDETNYAYISFLYPILSDINRVNKIFESKDVDHTKLCKELTDLIDMLVAKIVSPNYKINIFNQNIKDFVDNNSYLGYRFETHIRKLKENGLTNLEEESIRKRCIQFIINLIEELKNRLPENIKIMKLIERICLENALNHNKLPIIDLLEFFKKSNKFIEKVDMQWRQIHLLKWIETKNTNKFWYEVKQFKDALGQNRFLELANFSLSLLILPHSNADVERVFSTMNIVKTKLRNRMKADMLKAILRVKCGLTTQGKCCNNYEFPADVLSQIGTKEIYSDNDLFDISSEEDN